jgi:Arc/MetJ family transcription regulator
MGSGGAVVGLLPFSSSQARAAARTCPSRNTNHASRSAGYFEEHVLEPAEGAAAGEGDLQRVAKPLIAHHADEIRTPVDTPPDVCLVHHLSVHSCRGDDAMGRTNIVLDDRLVREALRRFGCRSKRELVHLALVELLKSARRRDLLSLRGRVKWEGDLAELRRLRP